MTAKPENEAPELSPCPKCNECDDPAWECEEDRCPGNGQPYECPTCHAETNYQRSFEVARSQPTVKEALAQLREMFPIDYIAVRVSGSGEGR